MLELNQIENLRKHRYIAASLFLCYGFTYNRWAIAELM
jgi:hypothetical protein